MPRMESLVFFGHLCIPMEFCVFLWFTMDFCGFLWNCVAVLILPDGDAVPCKQAVANVKSALSIPEMAFRANIRRLYNGPSPVKRPCMYVMHRLAPYEQSEGFLTHLHRHDYGLEHKILCFATTHS